MFGSPSVHYLEADCPVLAVNRSWYLGLRTLKGFRHRSDGGSCDEAHALYFSCSRFAPVGEQGRDEQKLSS